MKTKTKLLSIAMVFLIATLAISMFTLQAKSAASGLVGYWKFDEGSGVTVSDGSGNGNSGTLTDYQDTTLPQWVGGINGSALEFDGVGSFVQVPDSSSLDFSSAVTVLAWVYFPAGAHLTNTLILSKGADNGGSNLNFGICNESGNLQVNLGTDGGFSGEATQVYSVGVVPRNVWTNVAMTYNGSIISIYINGALDSTYSWTGGFTTNNGMPLRIGASNYEGAAGGTPFGFINGTIDDARIYNTTLSQQDIIATINSVPEFSAIMIPFLFVGLTLMVAVFARKLPRKTPLT